MSAVSVVVIVHAAIVHHGRDVGMVMLKKKIYITHVELSVADQ